MFVRYVQQLVMNDIPTTKTKVGLQQRTRDIAWLLVDDNQDVFVRKHSDKMLQLLFCGPLLILWHAFITELKEQLSLQRAE